MAELHEGDDNDSLFGKTDYLFGSEEHGFTGFSVLDFHGVEEISRPYRFAITLARRTNLEPVDLDRLVGDAATFALASPKGEGYLLRHGIVIEAEEIERTDGAALYRVVLGPHLELARHRRRCRTFLDQTLESIVEEVLGGSGQGAGFELVTRHAIEPESTTNIEHYSSPTPSFAWNLTDADTIARIRHRTLRRYVVQYNESDFAFVSRLLEEEGLSYFFEHSTTRSLLWISDSPGRQSLFAERPPYRIAAREGMEPVNEPLIRSLRASRRQRSSAVTMRDYDWTRAGYTLEGNAQIEPRQATDTHFEYPARDEALRERPCNYPSRIRLERFAVERSAADGFATARGLPVGRRITVNEANGESRGEHLVVRSEIVAVQHTFPRTALDDEPFGFEGRTPRVQGTCQVRFVALPASIPFRPAMTTARPRIDGIQTATVTAQDGQAASGEIHTNEWACVRVRFPWDQRADGNPSSKWIRVSQVSAGAGFGGLLIPRIGQEVLVSYVNGDPDEPLIVGRVYNVRNPLPTSPSDNPEMSTLKTHSSPGAEGNNELRFQDLAGSEEIYLHAQRDLNEVVGMNHSTSVGGDNHRSVTLNDNLSVGVDRTEAIGENLISSVMGHASSTVVGDRNVRTEGDEVTSVLGNRTTQLESDESHTVSGDRSVSVDGNHSFLTAGAARSVADSGHFFFSKGHWTSNATEDHHFATHKTFSSKAGVAHTIDSPDVRIHSERAELVQKEAVVLRVGACFLKIAKGMITLNDGAGASLSLVGGKLLVNTDSDLTLASGANVILKASGISLKSGSDERKDESFKDEELKASFIFRVKAPNEDHHTLWDDTYTLEAIDGSFSQSHDATADGERHDKGHSDIEFTEVPVGKKYDLKVVRGGKTAVILSAYSFEG